MANHRHGLGMVRIQDRLRALFQDHLGIQGFQAHQLFAILADAILTLHTALANEREGLLHAHGPAHVQIVGMDAAVGVLTGDDEAFFGPQYVHRFGTVRRNIEFLPASIRASQTCKP